MKPSDFSVLFTCTIWLATYVPLTFGQGGPLINSEDGNWEFKPPHDAFDSEALLDLRYLNEKIAGESGYVTLSRDRSDLVLGNGKPARFWAMDSRYYKSNLDRH